MALVVDTLFTLSPEQSGAVGVLALLVIVILDVLSAADDVPFNSPRDWLLWLTQWRSLGLWRRSNRKRVRGAGKNRLLWVPFHYFPLTGAFVPFMVAVLLGHFFHPGLDPVLGPGGLTGLGISLGVGLALSVYTYFSASGFGRRNVFLITIGGLMCGAMLWPVLHAAT